MVKLQIRVKDLSTYRTHLMGVATLMIIACHAPASGVVLPRIVSLVFTLGNYGVDIFLLLSGLGIFYSLSNKQVNTLHGALSFCKRRGTRIFVPYLIVYTPYCVILFLLGLYSIKDILLCLTTLEYWIYHRGAWFVSLILVLYLLSPFIYRLIISKYKWYFIVLFIGMIMLLCNNTFFFESKNSVANNIISALGRVPSFIIGMGLGQASKENKIFSFWWVLLLAALFFGIHRFLDISNGIEWMVVPLVVVFILVFIRLCMRTIFDTTLCYLGGLSLESYLTNITINSLLCALIPAYIASSMFNGRWLEYSVVIVFGLIFAYFVNRLSQGIITNRVIE